MPEKASLLLVTKDEETRCVFRRKAEAGEFLLEESGSLEEAVRGEIKKYHDVFVDADMLDQAAAGEFFSRFDSGKGRPQIILLTSSVSDSLPPHVSIQPAFAFLRKPPDPDFMKFLISETLYRESVSQQLADLGQRLSDMSLRDPETGLYNVRYLQERLSSEFKRASRYMFPLSVVLVEIESGKKAGSPSQMVFSREFLGEISQFLLHLSRENDISIRSGNTKFFVILPDTIKRGAIIFAKRLLEAFPKRFPEAVKGEMKLKVYAGVANYPADGVKNENNLLDLVNRALANSKKPETGGFFAFKGISRDDILSIVSRKRR